MSVVVLYLYANNECIIVGVVETLSIFLREPNYKVVDLCHFWNKTRQLDVLNHPKVSLTCLSGRTRHCGALHNHPYLL